MEERNSKRTVEGLTIEVQEKREAAFEFEERLNSLNDLILLRKNELSEFESQLEEFNREKETHRKNKLENAQLFKEVIIRIMYEIIDNRLNKPNSKSRN